MTTVDSVTSISRLNVNGYAGGTTADPQFFVCGISWVTDLTIGTGSAGHCYHLPTVDGSSGQVLCTDGSGHVGWGTGAGGASKWANDIGGTWIYPINSCSICGPSLNISGSGYVLCLGAPTIRSEHIYPTANGTCYIGCSGCSWAYGYINEVYASTLLSGGRLNIGASSACDFYVSISSGVGCFNGTFDVTYALGDCITVSNKFKVPVGTNCY